MKVVEMKPGGEMLKLRVVCDSGVWREHTICVEPEFGAIVQCGTSEWRGPGPEPFMPPKQGEVVARLSSTR